MINETTFGKKIDEGANVAIDLAKQLQERHHISDPFYMDQVQADFHRMASGMANPHDVKTIYENQQSMHDILREAHFGIKNDSQRVIRENIRPMQGAVGDLRNVHAVDGGKKIAGLHMQDPVVPKTNLLNLELADVIQGNAARNYSQPNSVIRPSTDIRGMPVALLEKVISGETSRNPTGMTQSSLYDTVDLIESAGGASNTELFNYGLDKYWTQMAPQKFANYQNMLRKHRTTGFGNIGANTRLIEAVQNKA